MTQALGMAPGLSSLVMYIGTGALDGQTVDDSGIFNAMATAKPLNAQLSSSWLWKPSDPTTDDVYFEEFAAQGQNLFIDAGDDGTWRLNDFYWPSDSVYVTSVGGTDLETTAAGGPWASETGWVDTGGGIGPDDFPIPSWQVATAAGCSECSQTYRNGPDVAANANFTFYVCADQEACTANLYGGTSFATPMWAGYLALANEQYLSNGATTTLGFINPALYTIGLGANYDTDFHDITSGGNTDGTTLGYDLSTGWGSPNGSALINALAGNPPAPAVTLTPASLAFGDVIVDVTSGAKNVTLKNTGVATLNIASIVPSGDFALKTSTKPCGSTLAAGKFCTITVTFTPTALGAFTGNITITDNAGNSPQTVPLSGTGIAPVTLTPATATFAAQTVGTTSVAKVFTLDNKQSVALTSIAISTTGDFSVSSTTCTASLAAKTKCTIDVVFKPTTTGTLKGSLQAADSAVLSPQTSSLTGTGKAAAK
jgi:kumamolisin